MPSFLNPIQETKPKYSRSSLIPGIFCDCRSQNGLVFRSFEAADPIIFDDADPYFFEAADHIYSFTMLRGC